MRHRVEPSFGCCVEKITSYQLVRHRLSGIHTLPQKVLRLLQTRGCQSRRGTAGCCLAMKQGPSPSLGHS